MPEEEKLTKEEFIAEAVLRAVGALLTRTPESVMAPETSTPIIINYAEKLADNLYGEESG